MNAYFSPGVNDTPIFSINKFWEDKLNTVTGA